MDFDVQFFTQIVNTDSYYIFSCQAKDVCHIWELGSGTTFAALLSVAAKVKFGVSLALILVLDLTFPETIVSTAETLLDTTKASILKSREFAENGVKYSSPDVEV